ncbi:MAG: hypothetical protein IPG92_12545 [Flavobacteriales bacterium]|nr:hypothetical protein [Flavobacteriales bacterium]
MSTMVVQASHVVTNTANVDVNRLVVETGGALALNSNTTLSTWGDTALQWHANDTGQQHARAQEHRRTGALDHHWHAKLLRSYRGHYWRYHRNRQRGHPWYAATGQGRVQCQRRSMRAAQHDHPILVA